MTVLLQMDSEVGPVVFSSQSPYRTLLGIGAAIALLLVASAWPQDSEEEDAFKQARNLYRDAADYATAAELLADFMRNYPASERLAEARLLLARSYKNNQRCDLAINAYEIFYEKHPDDFSTAEARQERAACLSLEGRYLDAAREYEEVQRRFSASEFAAPVLLEAAANYTYAEKPEQAAHLYSLVITEYGDKPQAHPARYRLARLLFARGESEAAQGLLEEIVTARAPEAPSALLLSGGIDLFLGRVDAARLTFARLHERFRASAQADSAYLELAFHLYDQQQFSQTEEAFQTAYKHIKNPDLKLDARLGLADALRRSLQPRDALGHYQALVKELTTEDPDRARAQLGLAITYGQTGEFTAAFNLFQQLIQAGPDTPEAIASFRELGTLYQRRGDYTGAITWYSTYLQKAAEAPDAKKVTLSLARIYAQSGYYEQAIPIFRELADGPSPVAAAQFELAQAFEKNGQPRPAQHEYLIFLERFPAHLHTQKVRDQIEYLNEFTVMDPNGLNQVYQQAQIDELSGTPRETVLLELAQALYKHHDIESSTRLFETYVASYPDRPYRSQAQFYLAESLLKLARQRQLEDRSGQADSLRQLALQEHRILAADETADEWSQKARIRLVETEAEAAPDSLRYRRLKEGFADFLKNHPDADSRDLALLRLSDARRHLGQTEPAELDTAIQTYRRLRSQFPQSPFSAQALFGLGLCYGLKGKNQAATDSLRRVLRDYPGSSLSAQVLFELGQLLLLQGQLGTARARFQELLLAYPAFPPRRAVQLQLADVHYQLEEYPRAIALYQQWLEGREAEDADGRVRRRLAESHHRLDEFATALNLYRQLLAQNPRPAGLDSVYFAQAILLVKLHREEEAVRQFLQVRDEFGTRSLAPQAAQRAAHLLFALERYNRAYQVYQPLLAATDDPLTYGQATLALFRLQRLKEARKTASAFAKRFEKDAVWPQRFQLEEGLYHLGQKKYEKALEQFRKIEEQGGEWTDDGAYYAALALWEQNRAAPSVETAARALDAQTRFVRNHPKSPLVTEVRLRLGNYYYDLQQALMAAGNYKAVVNGTATPEQKREAIWKLAKSYRDASEHNEAHLTVVRLLREFPDHPNARDAQLELGAILRDKGQDTQAIAHLEKVLEWAQGNQKAFAFLYMGESYQNMGKYRKAISTYYKVSYFGADASANLIVTADYLRARCHEILQEIDTAIGVYERIIQREGGNSSYGAAAREGIDALRRGKK
jgi:tetratricopeptide (TPR) repeat protein